jgi:hypothetical protein
MASAEHLRILVDKLNDLENVRVHEETGGVLMKKESSWHLLPVHNLDTLHICVNGELVADYDTMQINFVGQPTLFRCGKDRIRQKDISTLKKKNYIRVYKTHRYRSIIDEVTKADIKLYLPDLFYIAKNNKLYDLELIRLNVRPLIEMRVSFITSCQHVHLIENAFVFVSYLPVSVVDKRIQIEDSIYSLYFTPSYKYRLENNNDQKKVHYIFDCEVKRDRTEDGTITYRGMVIPGYDGLVFEVDGVWIGNDKGSILVLTPRWPKSGTITKPALL